MAYFCNRETAHLRIRQLRLLIHLNRLSIHVHEAQDSPIFYCRAPDPGRLRQRNSLQPQLCTSTQLDVIFYGYIASSPRDLNSRLCLHLGGEFLVCFYFGS
jgi:hypothetical protein